MNFLSHYYFERFSGTSERVVGSILPDLLKNVDKDYNFHPHRFEERLWSSIDTFEIDTGWKRHVEVDRLFHGSLFFIDHNHRLRKILDPILADLPIRASFFAHIAIELVLDHLLIRDEAINVGRLYEHLVAANQQAIRKYLFVIGLQDATRFMSFYQQFIEWRYIFDYADLANISKPLFAISKRVWQFEENEGHHMRITEAISDYMESELQDYKAIFDYIQDNIKHLS